MTVEIKSEPLAQFKGLFLFFFFVLLASIKLHPNASSHSNVEQWINLTNQYFYGQQDFLFSYGPLYWITGWATNPYSATSYWMAFVFQSAIFALFWASIVSMANAVKSILLLSGLFFLFFGTLYFSPAFFLWPFILVVYLDLYRPQGIRLPMYILLGALIALASYIRFFWGIVALATFGSYFVSCALVNRKFTGLVGLVIGLIGAYFMIGLLVFHDHSSLINYFIINNQLSLGNSVDMTLEVVNRPGTWVAVALIVCAFNVYLILHKRSLLLTVNVLLLVFLKLGFFRADHYVSYFVLPVAVLWLLPLLDTSKIGRAMLLVAAGCLFYLLTVPSFPGAPAKKVLRPSVNFDIDYASRMEDTYPGFKLSPEFLEIIGKNTIDVYPYNNEYVFANKLNYKHRPIFQSYMTLTPKLGMLNQDFFETDEGPQFVLWTAGLGCTSSDCNPFDSLDGKASLNEDPLTTSSILLNYHPVKSGVGVAGTPVVLLEKNKTVKKYSETLLGAQDGLQFGQWYKVPKYNGGMIKIKPEISFTLYGRLKNLLFRGNILKIKYKLVSGEIKEYRANILNAESGILVTPLLNNFKFSGPEPVEIMFDTSGAGYFKPSFNAKWVVVPVPDLKVNRPFDDRSESAPLHSQEKTITCEGYVDLVNNERYANQPVSVSGSLKLQGWLAASTKKGELFERTYVVITDSHGKQSYVETRTENRGDLVAAFNHANLSSAGYVSIVDVSSFDEAAVAGLAGLKDSTLYKCSQIGVKFSTKRP